ncbi:MAG: hypothetical protein V4692_13125, partial [Bdellovibrionota bacterium]
APASLEEFKIRLQMFMEEMMHWMLSNPECCQMIRREADLGLPIAEEVFASTFLQVFAALKKFIISAQEKGFVRKELDPQICASVLHLTLVEMTRHDHVSVKFFGVTLRDEKYQKKVREQFMSIYMNGLESV